MSDELQYGKDPWRLDRQAWEKYGATWHKNSSNPPDEQVARVFAVAVELCLPLSDVKGSAASLEELEAYVSYRRGLGLPPPGPP